MVHDIVLIGLELEHGIDHEFKIGQISNTAKKKKKKQPKLPNHSEIPLRLG